MIGIIAITVLVVQLCIEGINRIRMDKFERDHIAKLRSGEIKNPYL